MVEVEQIITIYRSHKNSYSEEEIKELNEKFRELEINCEVMVKEDDDAEYLMFKKIDL